MANLSNLSPNLAVRQSDAAGLIAGLVTVAVWGSAFVGIRAAEASLSPGSIALGRLLVTCAILVPVALVRREPLPSRRDMLQVAAYGVLWLAIYSTTLNGAERTVDAGTAAMLINTGPILIAILAGILLYVAAGLAYALAVLVQKPALARVSSFQVTWLGVVAATIACLPFAPLLANEATRAGAAAMAWTVYLGAVPTAIGFATWSFALRRTSAGRTASLNYLIPVVAIILGWLILGETPPLLALVGGALCITGVYIARRGPRTEDA